MSRTWKEWLHDLTPPLLWRGLQRLFRRQSQPVWQYLPTGWAYAADNPAIAGWNTLGVLAAYRRKWPHFCTLVTGSGPLGIAHEADPPTATDLYAHNAVLSFGYALTRTAMGSQAISLLDWGGGIGHYYLLARALLPDVVLDYHCKDLPLLAEEGARLLPNQHFYSDATCLERTYDLVMASASFHYSQGWQDLLAGLAGATGRFLYLAQVPTVIDTPSFVFVQRPDAYETAYLGWCLNRGELLAAAAAAGLHLAREFIYGYRPAIRGAPEQNQYRGYLFQTTPPDRSP